MSQLFRILVVFTHCLRLKNLLVQSNLYHLYIFKIRQVFKNVRPRPLKNIPI